MIGIVGTIALLPVALLALAFDLGRFVVEGTRRLIGALLADARQRLAFHV
jgi:hypothetical protein